ncbi:hypothetical protein [Nocardia brasiliensis]|uniref:hypothetical protein n=1 Tax=Nocardia brasiliensis TaxID=37326 RepID=UPI003D8A05FA
MRFLSAIVVIVSTATVALGYGLIVERHGEIRQRDQVSRALAKLVPADTEITEVQVQGSPFLRMARQDRVVSAHATVAAPGRADGRVELHDLIPSTGAVRGISMVVTLPFRPTLESAGFVVEPVLSDRGTPTEKGRIGTRIIRYCTEIFADQVVYTVADTAFSDDPLPFPTPIVAMNGQRIVSTSVTRAGVVIVVDTARRPESTASCP